MRAWELLILMKLGMNVPMAPECDKKYFYSGGGGGGGE